MAIMRLSKVAMIAALAAYALIVAYDNIVDYGSNYDFVKHVLSMDTTFPSNALRQRAISDASIWRLAYELIIGIEWLTGVLLTVGALVLLRRLGASAQAFNHAKVWAIAGLTVGFGLWFFGFMVIAGEYFAMWQSNVWNGQEAAFRIATEVRAGEAVGSWGAIADLVMRGACPMIAITCSRERTPKPEPSAPVRHDRA